LFALVDLTVFSMAPPVLSGAFLFRRSALSKVTEAAVALEEAFLRSAPSNRKKRSSEEEWTRSLHKFFVEAADIRRRFSLGLIGRARTAYLLQQKLIVAGFPADVVRKLVFSLILNSFTANK
jgi:hypothetical protein